MRNVGEEIDGLNGHEGYSCPRHCDCDESDDPCCPCAKVWYAHAMVGELTKGPRLRRGRPRVKPLGVAPTHPRVPRGTRTCQPHARDGVWATSRVAFFT